MNLNQLVCVIKNHLSGRLKQQSIKPGRFSLMLQRISFNIKETKSLYSSNGKKYIASRHKLHLQIVSKFMDMAGSVEEGKKPVAVLIGGGTASGKTTLRKIVIEKELGKRGIHAVTVDPDLMKEYIPEFESFKKTHPNHAAYLVHKESCDISALLLEQLIKNRAHLIYEGTMAKTKKYEKLIRNLKEAGYEVHAYVVDVPIEVAKKRSDERAKITGRKVPYHIIENTHKLVPKTVEAMKNQLDSYRIYDNQHGMTLIASNNYVEPKLYAKFLKKGGLTYRPTRKRFIRNKMFDFLATHDLAIQEWISEQSQMKKSDIIYIDDCYDCDVLGKKYPI